MALQDVAYTLLKGSEALKSDGSPGVQSDSLTLLRPAIGLLIHAGASGDIKVGFPDGSTTTIADGEVSKGTIVPMAIRQVFDTGTTLGNGDFRLATAKY